MGYSSYPLPRVRKIFIPDPGYTIFDADLSGADAQVVAWEAEDDDLKAAFRSGVKIHEKNAIDMFGERYTSAAGSRSDKGTPKGKLYDELKRGVHAIDYGATSRTLHLNPDIAWPMVEAEGFRRRWFARHPGILVWHQRVQRNLATSRTISNRFGYRIIFFDRIDSIFPEALAWAPQSTVAETCFRGALQLKDRCPWTELLLQVHDSLVFQVPSHRDDCIPQIRSALPNEVPYPDPLVIPWGLKSSTKSWGDCEEVPL
jgi:DNA polymerase I-like protein with 3'-5' exonuclease and polymerase domains